MGVTMSLFKSINQANDIENSVDTSVDTKEGWAQRSRRVLISAEPVGTVDEVGYFHISETILFYDKKISNKNINTTIDKFFSYMSTNKIKHKEDLDYQFDELKKLLLTDIGYIHEFLVSNDSIDNTELASFEPRWGKSIFTCQHCGAEGMQLTEVSPGEWMPFDLTNKKIHQCLRDKLQGKPSLKEIEERKRKQYRDENVGGLSLDNLLQQLKHLGFQSYTPRTSSWKQAFIASNETQTIYFLIGNKGIDFKFYDQLRETKLDQNGKLFTDSATPIVRNYYREADVNIHKLILDIAFLLVANRPISEFFMSGQGHSGSTRTEISRFGR